MKNFRSLILTLVLSLSVSGQVFAASRSKSTELLTLNKARSLYAKNKLKDAIAVYDKIPKSSDYWVEAIEEKAWAYTRMQDYEKALAQLKSILNPVFLPYVGPESIMLASFIDLKICNYKGVFDKIKLFKNEMLPRVEALEALTKDPSAPVALSLTSKMSQGNVTGGMLGRDLTKLPRYSYRDKLLLKSPKRMSLLAKNDLEEISKNLKKMKILEIEVIQRSYAYDKSLTDKDLDFESAPKDALEFPTSDKPNQEVWLDEIGNYEVKTQKCAPLHGGRI